MPVDALNLNITTSLVGAAGNVLYLRHIYQRPTHSALEGRTVFLLVVITALFIFRSVYWLLGGDLLHTITLVPSTLIPLAATLFVETLRRRHSPPPIKWIVGAGTVASFAMNWVLFRAAPKEHFFDFFRWFTIGTLAWLGLALLVRNRADLAPIENRFVDGITAACGMGVIFAATDFSVTPSWAPFQLGGIGALFFVYTCVRLINTVERRATIAAEMTRILIEAAVITLIFALVVPALDRTVLAAVFSLSLAFNLVIRVAARLRGLQIKSGPGTSFFRWLLYSSTASLDEFVDSLQSIPWTTAPVVLRGADLAPYDEASIGAIFDDAHPVWTLSSLRTALRGASGPDADGAEELVDLLETRDMTHAAMVGRKPLVLLLVNIPEVAGPHEPALEFALLQKYSRLLRQEEKAVDA